MRAMPDVNSGYPDYVNDSPRLDYQINFAKAGTYYVWVRGYRTGDKDNSCRIGLDQTASGTSDNITTFHPQNSWQWENRQNGVSAATISVPTAGVYTLNLYMREDGFRADKILITDDPFYGPPSGTGPDEINDTAIYQYDVDNRLIAATVGPNTAQYTYDYAGRRVSMTVNGVQTNFAYDGDEAIVDYDVDTVGTETETQRYIYGPGIDEVLSLKTPTDNYYLTRDGINSVTDVTDANGAVVEQYQYDVYGQPTILDSIGVVVATSGVGNRYLFTGREWEAGLAEGNSGGGLYYYRARHYDPQLGRFLQPDPLDYVDGFNLYEYAITNPVRYNDPEGTAVPLVAAVVGGTVLVVEAGLTAWDWWTTADTLADPCATDAEKSAAIAGLLAGIIWPGGGYSTAGKKAVSLVDEAIDARKAITDPSRLLEDAGTAFSRARETLRRLPKGQLKTLNNALGSGVKGAKNAPVGPPAGLTLDTIRTYRDVINKNISRGVSDRHGIVSARNAVLDRWESALLSQ